MAFSETFPKELRDHVYDLLCHELDEGPGGFEGVRYETHTICVELRLVSRQFKLEYDERMSANKHIKHLTVTTDLSWGLYPNVPLPSPQLAANTTSLTLITMTCDGVHEAPDGSSWECDAGDPDYACFEPFIGDLIYLLPHLQSLDLRLHTASDKCVISLLESLEFFMALRKLSELRIFEPQTKEPELLATGLRHLVIWTKEDGLRKDHEAVEQCRKRASA